MEGNGSLIVYHNAVARGEENEIKPEPNLKLIKLWGVLNEDLYLLDTI